jgi:murein L,D-transpeptidase YcbB/YkuD
MSKSVQRASENTVGGNVRQVSDAEQATQIVEFSEIKGNLTQQVLSDKKQQINDVLKEVLAAVEKMGLKKDEKADLKAHTKTAQAQMKAKKPEPTIMSACLGSIWGTLKKVATTAAVSGAGKLAMVLLDKIRAFMP